MGTPLQVLLSPEAMRPRILQLADEGHQGITKVKQHLRLRVWWPGMDMQAKRHVRGVLGARLWPQSLPQSPST